MSPSAVLASESIEAIRTRNRLKPMVMRKSSFSLFGFFSVVSIRSLKKECLLKLVFLLW